MCFSVTPELEGNISVTKIVGSWSHGDIVHRILYRVKRCFYPGYIGTASFIVNTVEDRIQGERKCEESSEKEE